MPLLRYLKIVLHQDFPFRVNRPLENLYGMHLYSKYDIEDLEVRDLIEKDVTIQVFDDELSN